MQSTDSRQLVEDLAQAAHIWFCRTGAESSPKELSDRYALLSSEETARYRRYRFDADRQLYLHSHAMLRHVLSRYVDVEPSDWVFSAGSLGRPEIASPDPGLSMRFNLSHTPGLVACIVSHALDCGVDAEEISARRHAMGIARRMFADEELRVLEVLEGQAFLERFFSFWTLREAYGKARGGGLAEVGRQVHFEYGEDADWYVYQHDAQSDIEWRFALKCMFDTHLVAGAVRAGGQSDYSIRYMEYSD